MVKTENNAFPYLDKELSWLSFNRRVLQEAQDPTVPLIERVRFLGIFSNNLDEFFRVRVADVRRLASFSDGKVAAQQRELLDNIVAEVVKLQRSFDQTNAALMDELAKRKIYLINENQLNEEQSAFVRRYFYTNVLSAVSPILLEDVSVEPHIDEASIYLGIKLELDKGKRYAILKVPTDRLPRFIRVPPGVKKRRKVLIVLENIIRHCLPAIFHNTMDIREAQAYTFKLTRDADLELDEAISESLIERVSSSLKRRKKADPVRFVYDRQMPEDLLEVLNRNIGIGRYDSLIGGGRYHNSKDFMKFPNLGPKYLEFRPMPPLPVPGFETDSDVLSVIRERDVLINYPFHSFLTVQRFMQAAAIDPNVRSVTISLYRLASQSNIANSLINAANNNKEVTAIIELQARFDEQANIEWSRRLTDAGVNVIFGITGLKVHSKLILVSRQEGNKLKYYTHIGTGNFNESTARVYTDFSLLTYNQDIGREAAQVFEFIAKTHKHFRYEHLLVSPYSTRERFVENVRTEIEVATEGGNAEIFIKCNNLVDTQIVQLLYEASQAGVKIRLIVRGMCSLVPGVKGISDNIKAISIVDRFLEHSRVYVFANRGDTKVYISSADLMTRNLDFRVEVSCPIYCEQVKQQILELMEIQWSDRVKARLLRMEKLNHYRPRGGKRKIRSQLATYKYWEKLSQSQNG